MKILIENVFALYPRLNQPYRFDKGENKSVPCDALADGACYEMQFEMTKEQAMDLHTKCTELYTATAAADPKMPAKPGNHPYKQSDQAPGIVIGKARRKAGYDGKPSRPVNQWDKFNNRQPEDFRLTTGSCVNLAVELVAYPGMGGGVTLRLNDVQVIDLKPEMGTSPFAAQEDAENANPFAARDNTLDKMAEGEAKRAAPAPVVAGDEIGDDDIPF